MDKLLFCTECPTKLYGSRPWQNHTMAAPWQPPHGSPILGQPHGRTILWQPHGSTTAAPLGQRCTPYYRPSLLYHVAMSGAPLLKAYLHYFTRSADSSPLWPPACRLCFPSPLLFLRLFQLPLLSLPATHSFSTYDVPSGHRMARGSKWP